MFFTSFAPQIGSPGQSVLLSSLALGEIFNLLGVVWLLAFALVVSRAGNLLRRPKGERRAGPPHRLCVLVGLGVRLATEQR